MNEVQKGSLQSFKDSNSEAEIDKLLKEQLFEIEEQEYHDL